MNSNSRGVKENGNFWERRNRVNTRTRGTGEDEEVGQVGGGGGRELPGGGSD